MAMTRKEAAFHTVTRVNLEDTTVGERSQAQKNDPVHANCPE